MAQGTLAPEQEAAARAGLAAALDAGAAVLAGGGAALDAVEAAVAVLEDDPASTPDAARCSPRTGRSRSTPR